MTIKHSPVNERGANVSDNRELPSLQRQNLLSLTRTLRAGNGHPDLIPAVLLDNPTSLDVSTHAGRAKLANVLLGGSLLPEDVAGMVMDVTDYVITGQEGGEESEDGSTVYAALYLILTSGDAVRLTSQVVIASLPILFSLFGAAPWNPALRLVLNEAKSRRTGRSFHTISVVHDDKGAAEQE